MLDALAQAARPPVGSRRLERVQYHVISRVADRVDGAGDPTAGGTRDLALALVGRQGRDARVAVSALVRLEHPRRLGTQRSIGEELERADTQPRVAEARSQTETESIVQRVPPQVAAQTNPGAALPT